MALTCHTRHPALTITEELDGEFCQTQDKLFAIDSVDPNMEPSEYPDIVNNAEFDEEFESDFGFFKAT